MNDAAVCSLDQKNCVPCQGGVEPLSRDEAETMLGQVPGWKLSDDGKWLLGEYPFKNFRKALAFVNAVGEIAEGEGHHPDIEFGWGYCRLRIQTHKIGGLHENDFILAAKVNAIPRD